MNKVIIVGHPQSGFECIGSLLEDCGMKPALPSKRDHLSATEITETLCKAHGVNLLNNFNEEEGIEQIQVAPIWQSMVLDLMLANYEQALWGWSDANAIYLLEYLKEQDDKFLFVLVYSSPESILYKQDRPIEQNEFQSIKDKWINYNSTILNFYTQNKERCILLHFNEIEQSIDKFIQLINEKIGSRHMYLSEHKVANNDDIINLGKSGIEDNRRNKISIRRQKKALAGMKKNNEESERFLLKNTGVTTFDNLNLFQDNFKYSLIKKIVFQDIAIFSLFEKLQEMADITSSNNIDIDENNLFLDVLNHMVNSSLTIKDLKESIVNLDSDLSNLNDSSLKERDQLLIQIHSLEKTLENNLKHSLDLKKQKDEIDKVAVWRANHIKELTQIKNDLEKKKDELERVAVWRANHIKELTQIKNDLEKKKDELEKVAVWRANHIKELNQVKDELYKKIKVGGGKELHDEKELLLSQIYMLQEEIEEYFIQNKQLQSILEGRDVNSKNTVVSNCKVPLLGAVERVKQDKSYRLGAKLIENSKTVKGLIQLPLILYKEANVNLENLPPLEEYEDAYKAEKIKNHLSYRIGTILNDIINEPVGIFKSPINLYKEVKVFNANKKKKG